MSTIKHGTAWILTVGIFVSTLVLAPMAVSAGCSDNTAVCNLDAAAGSVSGAVYQDWDQDGARGEDEPGLGGATVRLLDISGAEVAQRVTGFDGTYRFDGLVAGEYIVVEEDPFGYSTLGQSKATISVAAGECVYVSFGDVLLLQAPCRETGENEHVGAEPIDLQLADGDSALA